MAKIVMGILVTDIRGTIGGTVFSENKSGRYARQRRQTPTTKTPNRSVAQSNFAAQSTGWSVLSQAQRDLWDVYAAEAPQELFDSLGQSYFMSGWQWYRKINLQLITVDGMERVNNPSTMRPDNSAITNSFWEETFGINSFGCAGTTAAFGTDVVVAKATIQRNTTRLTKTSNQRVFKPVPDIVGPDKFWDVLQVTTLPIWGTFETNQRLFVDFFVQDIQGQRSSALTFLLEYTPL